MKTSFLFVLATALVQLSAASVFLPKSMHLQQQQQQPSFRSQVARSDLRRALRQQRLERSNTINGVETAMAIPGYGVAEQIFVGGFANFLSIYNLLVTGRILLSWFPQAQGVGALQPLYAITDPFLNLFRGVIPPLFGLDFSPIAAFFLLNVVSNATVALGCELPTNKKAANKKSTRRRLMCINHKSSSISDSPRHWGVVQRLTTGPDGHLVLGGGGAAIAKS